jgi:phosphoglycerate dehydrogenase-like enzyme
VVDTDALAGALRAGYLAGAALDVFEPEPLPAGFPLLDAPNLLVTPHLAGSTVEAQRRVGEMSLRIWACFRTAVGASFNRKFGRTARSVT